MAKHQKSRDHNQARQGQLHLRKETLRTLTPSHLRQVAGGVYECNTGSSTKTVGEALRLE
jgi:hypothetical protein